MNIKNWPALLFILFILNSCKKEAVVTKDVQFTATTYEFLGSYDSTGKPLYLSGRDTISPDLLSFIKTNLPEGQNLTLSHPELFTSSATADINITTTSSVSVTFVSAGAYFTNSIAFYTYPTGQPPASALDIKTITYIFPNAGNNTPLQAGDRVNIGTFNPGTTVGFLLLENSWNINTGTLDDNVVHFCTDDVLNPEVDPKLKRHAVLLNYAPENKVLISFDDLNRTTAQCDNDFNDVVIYCTVK